MVTISFMDLIRITSLAKLQCRKLELDYLIPKLDEIRNWASRQEFEELDAEEIMIDKIPF